MGNSLGIDLKGKVVLIKERCFKSAFRSIAYQLQYVSGGFGCSPHTHGTALACTDFENDKSRFEGYEVERLATDEETDQFWKMFGQYNPKSQGGRGVNIAEGS